jgi:hypothetical protein
MILYRVNGFFYENFAFGVLTKRGAGMGVIQEVNSRLTPPVGIFVDR